MRRRAWSALRAARYALPGLVGRHLPAPSAQAALAQRERGVTVTLGYFHGDHDTPQSVACANIAALGAARDCAATIYLSIKAPAFDFDAALIRRVAEAARAAGTTVLFDAHTPAQADRTLDLAEALLAEFPGTGCVLPARWARSLADAERFRDTSARIRLVKGEWADPHADPEDPMQAYLALASLLAGRRAPVGVATHNPVLAEQALTRLLAAGTPCELEQLRGLPKRATVAIARTCGAPIRIYRPFGPNWWPYALNKAIDRPGLIVDCVRDWFPPRRALLR